MELVTRKHALSLSLFRPARSSFRDSLALTLVFEGVGRGESCRIERRGTYSDGIVARPDWRESTCSVREPNDSEPTVMGICFLALLSVLLPNTVELNVTVASWIRALDNSVLE